MSFAGDQTALNGTMSARAVSGRRSLDGGRCRRDHSDALADADEVHQRLQQRRLLLDIGIAVVVGGAATATSQPIVRSSAPDGSR